MSETYTCAYCKGTFNKGRTDEEAEDELAEMFPGYTTSECDLVCDSCWKQMGFDS